MTIAESRKELVNQIRRRIDNFEKACNHNWSETQYTPIIIPPYNREISQWMRTCTNCGRVEVTTRAEEMVINEEK